MDIDECGRKRRRRQYHQCRGRGARAVVDEGGARDGQPHAAWSLDEVHGRPPTARVSGARRALRLQDRQLHPGLRPDAYDGRKEGLGPGPRRHRRHLARRLHHPGALSQAHHRGLPRRAGIAQSDAGPVLSRGAERCAGGVAGDCRHCGGPRHPRAGDERLARLLRRLPLCAPAVRSPRHRSPRARPCLSAGYRRGAPWREGSAPLRAPCAARRRSAGACRTRCTWTGCAPRYSARR